MMPTAVLMPAPEGGFTALNPEAGTTTEGESIEETIANLREATELYRASNGVLQSNIPPGKQWSRVLQSNIFQTEFGRGKY